MNTSHPNLHVVTGKLAESSVRVIVEQVARQQQFDYTIQVLPITVAALMTPKWLLRHVVLPESATELLVPGYLADHHEELEQALPIPVTIGPRDIRDLPVYFGQQRQRDADYGDYDIEILAEINHADRLPRSELMVQANRLRAHGADVIDLGCTPASTWKGVGNAVRALADAGHRVSIDSFDPWEVATACAAGAELVLSVNHSNREAARDWGVEVVVVPDNPEDQETFVATIDYLQRHQVPFRIDPILAPLGCGFAASLQRYARCREAFPDARMLMGIGNVTELTDADSAAINVLLLGICQELGIQSVLTTQVINWARSSVQECHLARQLVHFAQRANAPPKHLEPKLVLLRDERVNAYSREVLSELAQKIRDKNIRLFVAHDELHALSRGTHVRGDNPFQVMQALFDSEIGSSIDAAHAFYLGYEMSKATTALQLGKQYTQDQPLDWGFLTEAESSIRLRPPQSSQD